MPRITFDHGCLDYIFQCGPGPQPGVQFLCCCPSGACFSNGATCDSPRWDCRSVRVTGSIAPTFVMRCDFLGGSYRTRVRCREGLNEQFVGGSVDGEEPGCNSIAWPGGGGYILYRQAYVGARSCVGNTQYPVPGGVCNTGCSSDTSPSVYLVRAILQPFAGQVLIDGCASVIRKLHVSIDVVSSRLAADWCQCSPNYEFIDILSADYSAEYVNYCCPQDPPNGVRGTYTRVSADVPEVTYECYRTGPLTVTPVKWPTTLTVS